MQKVALLSVMLLALAAPIVSASDEISPLTKYFLDDFRLSETPAWQIEESTTEYWGDTSLKAFPKKLGRNFAGLVAQDNFAPLIAGVFGSAFSSTLDRDVYSYFADKDRLGGIDNFGEKLGGATIVTAAAATVFLTSRLSDNQKFRSFAYSLAQSYIIANTVTVGLKYSANRLRPDGSNNLSFPSGHTANAFTFATVISHYYGKKAAIPSFIGAAFIGATRVGKNMHYVSDVIAGATIGYIVGRTVVRDQAPLQHRKAQIFWAPAFSPTGGGAGLSLTIRF